MQDSDKFLINHIKHGVLFTGLFLTVTHLAIPSSSSNWRDYVPTMQLWLTYIPPLRRPNFLSFIHYALKVKRQEYTYSSQLGLLPTFFRLRKQSPPSYSFYKK